MFHSCLFQKRSKNFPINDSNHFLVTINETNLSKFQQITILEPTSDKCFNSGQNKKKIFKITKIVYNWKYLQQKTQILSTLNKNKESK